MKEMERFFIIVCLVGEELVGERKAIQERNQTGGHIEEIFF